MKKLPLVLTAFILISLIRFTHAAQPMNKSNVENSKKDRVVTCAIWNTLDLKSKHFYIYGLREGSIAEAILQGDHPNKFANLALTEITGKNIDTICKPPDLSSSSVVRILMRHVRQHK